MLLFLYWAHFVAFPAVSLQGTLGQIKAAFSGTVLPCPLGLLRGTEQVPLAVWPDTS